jgi:predicted NBD/HSP70 family sugar kinase
VLPADTPRTTPTELDAAMARLTAAAEDGVRAAVDVMERAGRRLARGIVIVTDLIDADSVVVGGANWERLAPYLTSAARLEFAGHATMRELHGVGVDGSAVGLWVGAVGAASRVLDAAFTPHASLLVAQPAGA